MRSPAKYAILTAVLISTFGLAVSAEDSQGRYSTDRLCQLSEAVGMVAMVDTLDDGRHYGCYIWHGYPLNVTVNHGEVTHIGIGLFDADRRKNLPASPIYDFLERYLLEYHVSSMQDKGSIDMLKADRFVVEKGQLSDLYRVANDTTLAFRFTLDDGRKYTVAWDRDDIDVLRVTFPVSNRLLSGYTLDEGERRLSANIARADTATRPFTQPVKQALVQCDSLQGYYHIAKGDFCILPIVNNDRCYFVTDSTIKLVYSPAYPIESLKNMLVSGEIDNSYVAKVNMRRYGHKNEEFEVPLNTLINYFMDEGCTPYFGIKGIYPERNIVTALYEMVNEASGYEHLMSVSFDFSTLPFKAGIINIRLTPYLPTDDIKSLFNQ